jgi:O-antigen/teichoic acid export membrane protein
MFSFGSKLFAVSLSNSFFTNIYNIIIGKLYAAEILGFYSKGYSLSRIPVNLILSTANQVFFPVFSKLQNEKSELKNTLQKVSKNLMMVTFPAMIGFIMISEELVTILLTEKWTQIVPYIQLLSISAIFHPLVGINISAINSLGRSDLYLKLDIFNKILIIILIYFTYKYGVYGLIYGQILSVVISHFLYSYFINILLNYSVFQQIKDLFSLFLISTIMGICVYSIEYFTISNLYTELIVKLVIGLFSYTFLLNLLRIKEFLDFKNMIISKFNF